MRSEPLVCAEQISDTRRGRSLYSALIDVKDHERLSQLFGVCTETGDCASTTSDVVSPRLGALIMQDLCSFFSVSQSHDAHHEGHAVSCHAVPAVSTAACSLAAL